MIITRIVVDVNFKLVAHTLVQWYSFRAETASNRLRQTVFAALVDTNRNKTLSSGRVLNCPPTVDWNLFYKRTYLYRREYLNKFVLFFPRAIPCPWPEPRVIVSHRSCFGFIEKITPRYRFDRFLFPAETNNVRIWFQNVAHPDPEFKPARNNPIEFIRHNLLPRLIWPLTNNWNYYCSKALLRLHVERFLVKK